MNGKTAIPNGDKLKRLRESKGWQQHELARHAGVPQRAISRAQVGNPIFERTLLAIAIALECTPDKICSKIQPDLPPALGGAVFLRLDREFESFTDEAQREFCSKLRERAKLTQDVRVTNKQASCVLLTLAVSADDAVRILASVRTGKTDMLGVIEADATESLTTGIILCAGDWNGFIDRLGPVFLRWFARFGIQHADSEDLMQELLIRIYRLSQEGLYVSKCNRPYFHTMVKHLSTDWSRKRAKEHLKYQHVFSDENLAVLTNEIVLYDEAETCAIALKQLRAQVSARDFAVFEQLCIEGMSVDSVRRDFGLKSAAIHQIKSRLWRQFEKEMRRRSSGRCDEGER